MHTKHQTEVHPLFAVKMVQMRNKTFNAKINLSTFGTFGTIGTFGTEIYIYLV